MKPLPKLCGADIELGNFILGHPRIGSTCCDASRALLKEITGVSKAGNLWGSTNPYWSSQNNSGNNSQDWGRKFLPSNGGCAYIDLNHLELCLPEVMSAYDHVSCWHAMLRIARKALEAANQKLFGEHKIQVLINNSDGLGHSWGSHLNFLISREAWDNTFSRKLHHLLYLASFQVSSLCYTGAGKVGSENGAPPVEYQISQRADFFEQLMGLQTTFNRPLVNSRDEPLCGPKHFSSVVPSDEMARLHVIFFDNTLCHVSSLLKIGVMQIILSMLEHELVKPSLLLDDPLQAVITWSHDPSLKARAKTASGKHLTAVELQMMFLDEAKRFVDSGACLQLVPHADEIISLWEDTLTKLKAKDLISLRGRLDWILKYSALERAIEMHPDLNWQSPEIKHLDHLYSSLDLTDGLYWAFEKDGLIDHVVSEQQIDRHTGTPPEDTRAWARAMILRRIPQDSADSVDWDSIRIKSRSTLGWSRYIELRLANPLGFTKESTEDLFQAGLMLEDLLECLAHCDTNSAEMEETNGSVIGIDKPL